ncbi:MAG TPA: isoprenylcysteine carboxylmethyltransferase family protein [Chitinophagaceae bacterium]|nr:isoprenylcysteine carboxylmethyltransferase family protein [Chitinophagaceae bacterium]
MNTQHWLLLFYWILYSVIHSFLAGAAFKKTIRKLSGSRFIYYRLYYSLFALITLILLLWYQFSLNSPRFYSSKIICFGFSMVLIVPGLVIMVICIRKYFYSLSGIKALQKNRPAITPPLHQNGLHAYVRHPLYFGTLLFLCGLFLMFPLLNNLIAVVVITVYVFIGIGIEEEKLLSDYGDEYEQYKTRVPKLIPKLKM